MTDSGVPTEAENGSQTAWDAVAHHVAAARERIKNSQRDVSQNMRGVEPHGAIVDEDQRHE